MSTPEQDNRLCGEPRTSLVGLVALLDLTGGGARMADGEPAAAIVWIDTANGGFVGGIRMLLDELGLRAGRGAPGHDQGVDTLAGLEIEI